MRKETPKKDKSQDQIEELTLLMLYLTHWIEKSKLIPGGFPRSWKTYPFDALDKLVDKGFLIGTKYPGKSKSVILTEEGVTEAKNLKEKYLR